MSTLIFLLFGTITGLLPTFIAALVIFNVVKAIVKHSKHPKTTGRTTSASATKPIIVDLKEYFKTNKRLQVEEDVYIEPSDYNNIQIANLNIFMRGEFIATLADYQTAFPNAYFTFTKNISKAIKDRKSTPETPVTPKEKPVTPKPFEKGAQYYIDQIVQLNEAIPEERISTQLDQAVTYLKEIKMIEDSYPDAREKTRKLYQYYLPMLTDILANYKQLAGSTADHSEFKASEDRLLKTVVLINGALKTIASSLLQEHYTELSVDMKTLEAVLKKDGLVDDGLTATPTAKKSEKQAVNSNG